MIEVYNDCKDKETVKPQPKLKLSVEEGLLHIKAVNKDGHMIAHIWHNGYGKSNMIGSAEGAIRDSHYSTDWAEWDKKGKFIKLT